MAEPNAEEQPKKQGGGGVQKILILALLLCNVLSLGGLGAYVMLGGSEQTQAAADPDIEKAAGGAADTGAAATEGKAAGTGDDKKGEAKAGEGEADGDEDGEEGVSYTANDLGPTAKLGSFIINLNDPGHPRYLKATIKAEVSSVGAKQELKGRDPQVRDIVISYLSSLAIKETYGARAKATIRDNIARRLNKILTTGEVKRIFFTDFMTQ